MKVGARLPIFRSAEQERLLAEVFVFAERPLALSELAGRAGTSLGGTHKEVERLEAAGLVKSHTFGRSRLIEADDSSPVYGELRGLLLKTAGPAPLLKSALSGIGGIAEAFIYGSWADPEVADPADIDVMVIGNPDVDRIYSAAESVEREIGREIDISIRSVSEWAAATDPFVTRVKKAPRLPLVDRSDLELGLGQAVAVALRRLQQKGIGEDLRAPLSETEVEWLDADLESLAGIADWGPEEDWTDWMAGVSGLTAVYVEHEDVEHAVNAAKNELEGADAARLIERLNEYRQLLEYLRDH